MFTIRVIFVDLPAEGETCTLCKQEIEEVKWVMMLDFGDPVKYQPKPLSGVFCGRCLAYLGGTEPGGQKNI